MQRIGIQNDLIEIGGHYGTAYYMNQLSEECAELIQAVTKINRLNNYGEYLDRRKELLENLYEEMGDVEICIGILKNLYHCEEEVYASKMSKVKRQKERMKKE